MLPSSEWSGWLSLLSLGCWAFNMEHTEFAGHFWFGENHTVSSTGCLSKRHHWVRFFSSLGPPTPEENGHRKWPKWRWPMRNSSCTEATQRSGWSTWGWRGEGRPGEEQEGDLIASGIRVMLEVRSTFVMWEQWLWKKGEETVKPKV